MRSVRLASAVATALVVTAVPTAAVAAAASGPGGDEHWPTAPSLSANGQWAVYVGETADGDRLYRHDTRSGAFEQVPLRRLPGQGPELGAPSISDDGRSIVYVSQSRVPQGDVWDPTAQVHLTDAVTGETRLVSTNSAQPRISADGQRVVLTRGAGAKPGTDVAVAERTAQGFTVSLLSAEEAGVDHHSPSASRDGSRTVFVRDAGAPQVWLAERSGAGQATVRQVAPGEQPALSQDGSAVALVRPQTLPGGAVRTATWVRTLDDGVELQADVDPDGMPLTGDSSQPRMGVDADEVLLALSLPDQAGHLLVLRDVSSGDTREFGHGMDLAAGHDFSTTHVVHVADGQLQVADREQLPAVEPAPPTPIWMPLVQRAADRAKGFGYVLRADPATWEPVRARALKRQWLRNGRAIPGATGLTYEITARDVGREIALRETLVMAQGENGVDVSRAYKAKPDRSVLTVPKRVRQPLAKRKVQLRVRVRHVAGGETYVPGAVRPQGQVKVMLGGRRSTATVGADGWVKISVPAPRSPGRYTVRVQHRGTAFVTAAPTRNVRLVVRRNR